MRRQTFILLFFLIFSHTHAEVEGEEKFSQEQENESRFPDSHSNYLTKKHHFHSCKKVCRGPTGPAGPTGDTNGWLLQGNFGTISPINYIGTNDDQPFLIVTNGNNLNAGTRFTTKGQIETLGTGQSVFLGEQAGDSNGAGTNNVFVGYKSGALNDTGMNNTALGWGTLGSSVASNSNTAVGAGALISHVSGDFNTSVGYASLGADLSGMANTALGFGAIGNNIDGAFNSAIGFGALNSNTGGEGNVAIGFRALLSNTTGGSNTAIGDQADVTSGTFSNATAIGANAKVNSSNKIRLGDSTVTVIEGQVPYTNPSDGRIKTHVKENVPGMLFIGKLRPITYQLDIPSMQSFLDSNPNQENTPLSSLQLSQERDSASESESQTHSIFQSQVQRTGFIAQEVEQAAQSIGYDFDGVRKPQHAQDYYGLAYAGFVPAIVKGMQEQQALIEQLQREIEELKAQVAKN